MSAVRFLFLGYQNFAYTLAHIKSSYAMEADEERSDDRAAGLSSQDKLLADSKDRVRAKIEKRREFRANYFTNTLISCLNIVCCCLVRSSQSCCCWTNRQKYKKFKVAEQRVLQEHDL